MYDVILRPGRERSMLRRHPWVLSGAVARADGAPPPGALVRLLSASGELLGAGHYSPGSTIVVRLLEFGKEVAGEDLLEGRIAEAAARRACDPLLRETELVRLVNAEGDGLPGLVVDRYDQTAVVKFGTAGMATRRERIAAAVGSLPGVQRVFERADGRAARSDGFALHEGVLLGEPPPTPLVATERGREFEVDVTRGQKTGFYLDQRENRDLVRSLAAGREVLDVFAYTGGFSVAAAQGGAASVTLVESSAGALEGARSNLARNAPSLRASYENENAFRFLRREVGPFDLLVVDPPPLARRRRDVARAARGYKDLFLHALRRAAPGAHLLFFACSHHVDRDLFQKIVFGASLDAGRPARVLRALDAASDHPVALDHPEGRYLQGLLLQV